MTETEWKDLPTMPDVAGAQLAGWEIQHSDNKQYWAPWVGEVWSTHKIYRARPRQPKMKKVKMLCWYANRQLIWCEENFASLDHWRRVSVEDKEIEVQDE